MVETFTLIYVASGVYNYENSKNKTYGVWIWNSAGYYDCWSSHNGGNYPDTGGRRAVPRDE